MGQERIVSRLPSLRTGRAVLIHCAHPSGQKRGPPVSTFLPPYRDNFLFRTEQEVVAAGHLW